VTAANPFTVLGLPTRADLTDEQVRAAWRTIATATHPDRADAARYAAASAAYAALRTPWGRSEAYADLMAATPPKVTAAARTATRRSATGTLATLAVLPARVRHGRPLRLLARIAAAVVLALVTVHTGAGGPAETGVVAGLVIWCALTVRGDLAPPPGR
jgi:hypothetical protein